MVWSGRARSWANAHRSRSHHCHREPFWYFAPVMGDRENRFQGRVRERSNRMKRLTSLSFWEDAWWQRKQAERFSFSPAFFATGTKL